MDLNREQREIVEFGEGVLQVVAGPGTGKTEALVNRVVELLRKKTPADSIMMVTFTRKAAEEFEVRLLEKAQEEGVDPLGIYCGTLHSLCFTVMEEFGYEELLKKRLVEDFGKRVLLFDLFRNRFSEFPHFFAYFFGSDWKRREEKQLFGKVETLIERVSLYSPDLEAMRSSDNPAVREAAEIYRIYRDFLDENGFIDFNGVEKLFLEFLDSNYGEEFLRKVKHLFVDEYQDTNPLDEAIYFKIASQCRSFVVVGDEDQSLFSFRGATVKSFINFRSRVERKLGKTVKVVFLRRNYRSVKDIVDFINYYISEFPELERVEGKESLIHSGPEGDGVRVEYLRKESREELARKVAEIIEYLKKRGLITKFSDAVLLVPSAREEESSFVRKLKEELERRGIKVYNPRSRSFGRKRRARRLLNALGYVLNGDGSLLFDPKSSEKSSLEKIKSDFDSGRVNLLETYYRVASLLGYLDAEDPEVLFDVSHLSVFISQLQDVYSREELLEKFFTVFIPFVESIDDPEIPPEFLPEDHFPVMTIHQAKGLEFPVVFVAVDWLKEEETEKVNELIRPFVDDEVKELLPPTVDVNTVKRKLYVAYSRAQQLLIILDGRKNVKRGEYSSIYPGGDQRKRKAYRREEGKLKLSELEFKDFKGRSLKGKPRLYSFTGDVISFRLCPRLYGYRKFYGFASSSAVQEWFGTAIHRTLRQVYAFFRKNGRVPNGNEIEKLFKVVRSSLEAAGVPEPEDGRVERALSIVKRFVEVKGEEFYSRVVGAELPVSVKKEGFYLKGVIDALLEGDNGLEIWDFKSMKNPGREGRWELLKNYERQLKFYSMMLSKKGKRVGKLVLCFLNEYIEEDPEAEEVFQPESDGDFWSWVREVLEEIEECRKNNRWPPAEKPDRKTCLACDFKFCCPKGRDIIQATRNEGGR